MHPQEYDLIVAGSGIAGLFAAITARDQGQSVLVLTKARIDEANTRYAQGGIAAAVGETDSPTRHAIDTCKVGAGLNDHDAVSMLTHEAKECIDRLVALGVRFDLKEGALALTREAGHTASRVLHAGGDATGLEIQRVLSKSLRPLGIEVREHRGVTDLLCDGNRVTGVAVSADRPSERMNEEIHAARVLLATGGAGWLYSRTTNPPVATGDGLALAYRAGAQLMDLEFFQFHPTALALPQAPAYLISEAARGEGGILRDGNGARFMLSYHVDAELAPRDVVSRAIWSEMHRSGANNVFLDLTAMSANAVRARFPSIYQTCLTYGVDVSLEPIPVAPAAHYFMGGIRTDTEGGTSIPGLLAAGEVAASAVHGANRLASNSLLEGLVFGRRAALSVADCAAFHDMRESPVSAHISNGTESNHHATFQTDDELRRANWQFLGIIRSGDGLAAHADLLGVTMSKLSGRQSETVVGANGMDDRVLVSALMTSAALNRRESRGAHFRSDFPEPDPSWLGHIVQSNDRMTFMPVAKPIREALAV